MGHGKGTAYTPKSLRGVSKTGAKLGMIVSREENGGEQTRKSWWEWGGVVEERSRVCLPHAGGRVLAR